MQYLFLLFAIFTTAKAQGISENDSCYSTEDVTVPYTLWIGTDVEESHTIDVTVKRFTPFYGVVEAAEEQDPGNYSGDCDEFDLVSCDAVYSTDVSEEHTALFSVKWFEATCSEYGHYVTSIGGNSEDSSTTTFWLLFALESTPDPLNPPNSTDLSPAGVDGIRVVDDEKHYLFWLRNITGFYGQ